ncbi:hypothetical protein ASD60_18220 [Pseudomonas sp. Root562]|nr:hypothetical protein ASD60_18220 [Pseudomonas sp. Root562]
MRVFYGGIPHRNAVLPRITSNFLDAFEGFLLAAFCPSRRIKTMPVTQVVEDTFHRVIMSILGAWVRGYLLQ